MSLLQLTDIEKTYGSGPNAVPAVRGVDLVLQRGETVGLVGESGCGKTSLGRVVVGLQSATGGEIVFDGQEIDRGQLSHPDYRRRVQMVFQHPDQSLNPRMRVEQMLAEPLRLLTDVPSDEIEERIVRTLTLVGLGPGYMKRRSKQLSGGQQQRVAIARALICEPDLVVLDELFTSLPDETMALDALVTDGESAVIEVTSSGTDREGKPYEIQFTEVLEISDGRFTEIRTYIDPDDVKPIAVGE